MRTKTAWIGVGALFAGIAALVTWDALKPANTGDAPIPETSAWTPPEGYSLAQTTRGAPVGLQWGEPTDSECRGSGVTCFAVNVVTEKDCPRSLYVSVALLNGMRENIGWTNDTAKGVRAGDRVRMTFTTYERGADTARVAEINCY